MMVTHSDTIVSNRYSICICLEYAYTYSFLYAEASELDIWQMTYAYVMFECSKGLYFDRIYSHQLWTCAGLFRVCISSTLKFFNFRLFFPLHFHKTRTQIRMCEQKTTSCLLNIILTRQWNIAISIKLCRTLSYSKTTNNQ